jgi:hypothetical protein
VAEHDCDVCGTDPHRAAWPLCFWLSPSRSIPSHSCRSSFASAYENHGGEAYLRWADCTRRRSKSNLDLYVWLLSLRELRKRSFRGKCKPAELSAIIQRGPAILTVLREKQRIVGQSTRRDVQCTTVADLGLGGVRINYLIHLNHEVWIDLPLPDDPLILTLADHQPLEWGPSALSFLNIVRE